MLSGTTTLVSCFASLPPDQQVEAEAGLEYCREDRYAGTTATGRYQFTDSVYFTNFSQPLPYLPQRPSHPGDGRQERRCQRYAQPCCRDPRKTLRPHFFSTGAMMIARICAPPLRVGAVPPVCFAPEGSYRVETKQLVKLNAGIATAWNIGAAVDLITRPL
jgi:hypothetical protein